MIEACTVSHAESRRCLPAWMLHACSNDEVTKTENQNELASGYEKPPGNLGQIKLIKRTSRKQVKTQDTIDAGELRVLRQCEGREKATKKGEETVKEELEDVDKETNKDGRKIKGRVVQKNTRKRKLKNVGMVASLSGAVDDEIELTVEDLVSIAEEHVNADKEKQRKLDTTKSTHYEEHAPCPPIATTTDTRGSVLNARSMKGLLQCTTITTSATPSECRADEDNTHQQLQFSSSIKTAGDVAQDMLDIFLGPLLRKPSADKNKTEAIESITATVRYVPEKKKDLHSEVQKQWEPVAKRKSRLKD